MKFKVIIEGRSKQELVDNMREYLGLDKENCPTAPQEQDDFVTDAAKLPEVPKVEAIERARLIPPSTSNLSPPSPNPTSSNAISNDYGLDSKSLPWDERIHSVTQAKNKDGSWRTRRGAEDTLVRQVEAELRGRSISGAPIAERHIAAVLSPIPISTVASVSNSPPIPVAPPSVPIPPPQPLVPAAHSLKTFRETLIPTLAKLVREQKLDQAYINTLCAHFGVQELWKVNDAQLEELFNNFVQYGMIVKAE